MSEDKNLQTRIEEEIISVEACANTLMKYNKLTREQWDNLTLGQKIILQNKYFEILI